MKNFTKEEKSWILYDWANSVYATIIMAVIFPIYFSSVAANFGFSGDIYWGYATSIATLIVAVSAPFLGSFGDFEGMKKKLFTLFVLIGVGFTLIMAITDNPKLMLVGYCISYIGFAVSNLFYDSFLTDVSKKENMDKVSAYGFAMGYVGGSTIAFLISISLIMFGEKIGIDTVTATKMSVVLTSLWWGFFSIPMFKNVKQVHYVEKPDGNTFIKIMTGVRTTVKDIFSNKKILPFMIAYFFYIDGVGTIIHMATSYGSTLGLNSNVMIIALLVTQLVAVPCSILFSTISAKIGTIKMLLTGITIYILVCFVGFYMGFSLEPHQKAYQDNFKIFMTNLQSSSEDDKTAIDLLYGKSLSLLSSPDREEKFTEVSTKLQEENPELSNEIDLAAKKATLFLSNSSNSADFDKALSTSTILFWILSILVGTSQGGIQALSRSYFGKIIPAKRSNEFFGFFDIFGKFAAVVGPMLYSVSAHLTGRSSIGILSIILLFIVGWIILFKNRKTFEQA